MSLKFNTYAIIQRRPEATVMTGVCVLYSVYCQSVPVVCSLQSAGRLRCNSPYHFNLIRI